MNRKLLIDVMEYKGVTPTKLAEAVGVEVKTVLNWLAGRTYPNTENIGKMAAVLEISPDLLLDEPFKISNERLKEFAKEIGITEEEFNKIMELSGIDQVYHLNRLVSRRLRNIQEFQNEIDRYLGKLLDVLVAKKEVKK